MDKLRILSFNVKGLGDKLKREKIFNFTKQKVNEGIILLQETHSSREKCDSWSKEFDGNCFFNHGTSNSKGVAILLTLDQDYKVLKYEHDGEGRLQMLSIELEDQKYLIVNVYNPNTEKEQVAFLSKLNDALKNFPDIFEHNIIIGGDFNFIYDILLDANGGNPSLKLKSITEINNIKITFDLCDIFRVRFPNTKRFSFRQKTPKLSRRLDHFLISESLQDSVEKIDILASIASDHSPVFLSIKRINDLDSGPGYWKFNNSLLQNNIFCDDLRKMITAFNINNTHITDQQVRWELLKFELREFSIKFSKKLAHKKRERGIFLENIVKDFETKSKTHSIYNEEIYLESKSELEQLHDRITQGIILRSKCQWYQDGEKSSKFFLNLEKIKAKRSTIKIF